MKLAFCIFKFFPFGGLQKDFFRIVQEVKKRGHKVDVFTRQWRGERVPGINLHLLPSRAWTNWGHDSNFVEEALPTIKKSNFDAVIGFNKMPGLDFYFAGDACLRAKIKNPSFPISPRIRKKLDLEGKVFSPQSKTYIFLLLQRQAEEFRKFYNTPPERLHILPPYLDPTRISPNNAFQIREDFRRRIGIDDDQNLILFVGSDFKKKGLDRALKAFQNLSKKIRAPSRFFVLGEGKINSYKILSGLLGIKSQIQFLGGRNDLSEWLLAADLLIHPARIENTGLVILESISSGLPVLATDVCGYAPYIQESNCGKIISSPFEQRDLNSALEKMLTSPLKNSWRENGLQFGKKLATFRMEKTVVDLLERHFWG